MENIAELKNRGAGTVVEQLRLKGWTNINNTATQPGPIDVVAVSPKKKVFVSVQPTIGQRDPVTMSQVELDQIRQMAASNQAEPFQVNVGFKEDMTTIDKVQWQRL